ncbi:MAG: hypothetical protein OQK35_06980 [Alphaproteobacteria bacterium]|nr:hypothetical protein [Rhodospirillales bacterium]MCW9046062.1 hypothetical protein [Alphaproteobacteria bacterium]
MIEVVEIYICKKGQNVKDGQMVVTDSIANKIQAQSDAVSRCKTDSSINRVVYYDITNGGQKVFYSHNLSEERVAKKPKKETISRTPRKKKTPPKKKGFWEKILN